MEGAEKNVLFALSTCSACKKTKALLERESVHYVYVELDTVDSDSREQLRQKVRAYNSRETFPTLILHGGEKVVVGYGEEAIMKALKDCGLV